MFFESDTTAVQALASKRIRFPYLQAAISEHNVISEFLGDPFEQNCDFDVIIDIDQPSTRLFALINQVQHPSKPVTEISSLRRMILRRALQQTNFSASPNQVSTRCAGIATFRIRFVFLGGVGCI